MSYIRNPKAAPRTAAFNALVAPSSLTTILHPNLTVNRILYLHQQEHAGPRDTYTHTLAHSHTHTLTHTHSLTHTHTHTYTRNVRGQHDHMAQVYALLCSSRNVFHRTGQRSACILLSCARTGGDGHCCRGWRMSR